MLAARFFSLKREEKKLFLEAACETLLVRIITTLFKTKKYASWLGKTHMETPVVAFNTETEKQIRAVKTAIARCRHVLWARKCLVESIAGQKMLHRRQIPATLYMGVAKNEKGKMIAHAWLRSGNIWISGGKNHQKFTVVGFFS